MKLEGKAAMNDEIEPDALRTYEVAKLVGCTVQGVALRRKSSGFPVPTVKVGRERLWKRSEVEAWIVANTERRA